MSCTMTGKSSCPCFPSTNTNFSFRAVFKGNLKNDYVLPSATYELGAIAWEECCNPPETMEDVNAYRKQKMEECEGYLDQVKNWENFILDMRIGLRVQSGLETLKWFKGKMEWSN